MAQPFSYMLNVPNPADAVLGGVQQGMQLGTMMERADLMAAQRRQTDLENQALQVKAQREAAQRAALDAFYKKPATERTAADYEAISATLPKEMAENVRASFDAKTKEEQRQDLLFGSQVLSALRLKDTGTASQMLQERAKAYESSGMKAQAQAMQNLAEMTFIDPERVEVALGPTMAVVPGGKEFIDNLAKQQATQFEAQLQPSKMRKAAGEAQEAETKGRYAEKVIKSEIGQRGAAAAASMAAAEASKASARRSLAQAQTEDETRAARADLFKAQAELARGKLQKAMGNPEDARQGALHGISVIDKLLDPKRKDDIDQIFGAIGASKKGEFKAGAFRPEWTLSEPQMSILADIDQLGGRMFLEQAQKMRGLGQLTEQEGKKIVAAAGNLTRNQAPDRLMETLKTMREVLAAGAKRKPGEIPGGVLEIGDGGGAQGGAQPQGSIALPGGFTYTPEGD